MTGPSPEWQALLDDLERRRAEAMRAGGEPRIEREHAQGRMTARERIAQLVDDGSFLEFGTFVTTPTEEGVLPATFICGLAEIDGRPVAIGAEDFTVERGGVGVHLKRLKGSWGGFVEEIAYGYRIPLVLLMQSAAGSVGLQELKGYPELVSTMPTFPIYELMEDVPVVTAVLGPTAGSSAARASISHFSVMTDDNGCLFAGGPPLVKQALGIDVDKLELGGADVHARTSGLIDNAVADDAAALAQVKRFLSFLPGHVGELPAIESGWTADDQERLLEIVSPNGRQAYNPEALVECLVDVDSFFEIGRGYGRALKTGLARIEGHAVGVLATDNRRLAGAMDAATAQKQEKFVRTCDTFHIPLVYLVDIPGFMIGPDAERSGVLKFGGRALEAIQRARVPVYTIQVRRSFGLGGQATGSPNLKSVRLAWPSGIWGDMPVQGGIAAGFGSRIAASADPAAERRAIEERYKAQTSIWSTVERFGVEEMIDPRATRGYLARLLRLAYRVPPGLSRPERRGP
jgi:methylmalonyl-CoA decarboxylase subunit alpha